MVWIYPCGFAIRISDLSDALDHNLAAKNRNSDDERLDSWKEVARYLKREVRTVQRWEKSEGLPIHRKHHDSLASVYAYKSELDQWWNSETENRISGAAPAAPARPMVAVLPLRNLSGDPAQEYFSDGMTEELIAQIGRMAPERLSVIGRSSAMKYKNSNKDAARIAAELGVNFILDGSVRRSADRVRITVELVRAKDRSQAWSESYDRELSDVLRLQTEVAQSAAQRILATVLARTASGRALDPEAYDEFLRGRFLWNRRNEKSLLSALTHMERAVRLDPSYAAAHAGLADCLGLLASIQIAAIAPLEAMPRAKAMAARALELDPNSSEAHASAAHVNLWFDWDFQSARRGFERALELNPGNVAARQWYAEYLAATEALDESIIELDRAQVIEPQSLILRAAVAGIRYFQRRYDECIALSRATLEMDPDFVLAYLNVGRAYVQNRNYRAAIEHLEHGFKLSGQSGAVAMTLGYGYAAARRAADAQRMLTVLHGRVRRRYVPAFYFAAIYAGLHDKDRAIEYLRKAYEERCDYLLHLNHEPAADPVRSDPRFDGQLPHATRTGTP